MTDQSAHTTEVQSDEPMSFIGVTRRLMDEGAVTGAGTTAASPEPTLVWVTAHKAGNLEHGAQPAGSSTGWRVSLPGDSMVCTLSDSSAAFVVSRQLAGLI